MNGGTFFVVAVTAVTLVLESSATPATQSAEISHRVDELVDPITGIILGSADVTVQIDEEFIQFAHEAIEGSKTAFDDAQKVIGDALSTATGEKKNNLEEIEEWLDGWLGGAIESLSEELLTAIDSGSVAALKEVKANINEAIVYTSDTMDGFNDKLLEGDTKDGFNAAVNRILELSAQVAEGLEDILAGVNA